VKTVHLHLEPDNTCLVSTGVLASLKRAGLTRSQLAIVGGTKNPPPLTINGTSTRAQIDNTNRKVTQWGASSIVTALRR
jgi:hypothetical protein